MRAPRRFLKSLLAIGVVAFLVAAPGRALAHTEVEFTMPADGTTVGEPIDEISVGFTEPVTLIGNGFRVLDPTTGSVIEPFVVTDDDMIFRLQLDPPLGGGQVGVEYEVASADGHPVTGSFTFNVAAPAPTTPPSVPATQAPTTTVAAPVTTAPAMTAAPTTVPSVIATAPTSSTPTATAPDVDDDNGSDNNTIFFAGAAIVAAVAIAFLVIRSRKGA
jgi:methionine-rich copper-binding protein CopC